MPGPTKALPLFDLIPVQDVRVGDVIQVSTRARPTAVTKKKWIAGKAIEILLATAETRTYLPLERVILRSRPQELNL